MLTLVPNDWKLEEWHGFTARFQWRVTDEGIQTLAFVPAAEQSPVLRTRGAPVTITRIWEKYGEMVKKYSEYIGIDPRVTLAVIATESHGHPDAARYETGINTWSFGLMQLLTTTARGVLGSTTPLPGDTVGWRAFLTDPEKNILAGTRYLSTVNRKQGLKDDPVLMYAAYNSGTARVSGTTKWRMVYYGNAMDNFAAWYGDACEVLK